MNSCFREKVRLRALAGPLVIVLVSCSGVFAQEGIFTMAATEPSKGVWMFRQQFQYQSLGRDPTDLDRTVNEWDSRSMIAYGLTPQLSFSLMVPYVYRDTRSSIPSEADTINGLDDITLMGHWRIYQEHSGPIDTTRFSLMAGAKIPTETDGISGDTVEPLFGGVFTMIRNRHGFDFSLMYQYSTGGFENPVRGGDGTSDAFYYNAAYLFRVAPERYTASTSGAWYVLLEMTGLYETNGDNGILLAPGIMYEGRNYALECAVQFPLLQDIEHRLKTDYTITVGFRFLF